MPDEKPTNPVNTPTAMSWPPPGLETIYGTLWPLITLFGVTDIVLLVPLTWVVASDLPFWSLGPLGQQWWALPITTAAGLFLSTIAFYRLFRLVKGTTRAITHGHNWRMTLQVAGDATRDAGFVLLGARRFSKLPRKRRETILSVRLFSGSISAAGVVGAPIGFAAAVVLTRLGITGPGFVFWLAVVIPLLLVLLGVAARLVDALLSSAGLNEHVGSAALDHGIAAQVATWYGRVGEFDSKPTTTHEPSKLDAAAHKLAPTGIVLVTFFTIIPIVLLSVFSAVGPILASVAVPQMAPLRERLAKAEAFRDYRLPQENPISPIMAGEALHRIFTATTATVPDGFREPVARYDVPWFSGSVDLANIKELAISVLQSGGAGTSNTSANLFREINRHPVTEDLSAVARTADADVISARYVLPFADDISPFDLPIPQISPLQQAAIAHLARAAEQIMAREFEDAEETIRELISVGFVLIDHGPTVIDNIAGSQLIGDGADALIAFYQGRGRDTDAERLIVLRSELARIIEHATFSGSDIDVSLTLRLIPDLVVDPTTTRGVRWELFGMAATFAPCLNPHRVIAGPGERYDEWIVQAKNSLVQNDGDLALFELLKKGWFPTSTCGRDFRQLRWLTQVD